MKTDPMLACKQAVLTGTMLLAGFSSSRDT